MVKKDRESMEELWSKRFDEEVDHSEDEPMSRKAKREREQSISPVLTVTVIFLALLIILPITTYAWYLNRDVSSEDPSGPNIEQVVQNDEDEEDIEEEPEDIEEVEEEPDQVEEELAAEETEVVEEIVEETVPESTPETDNSEPVTSEPSQSESTETTETTESQPSPPATDQTSNEEPAQGAEYYTVAAGDNMYRIALNHGMSTEELMQLNNTQDQTVYVGQELRVR